MATSETTLCYEQGYANPVIYDLEKVNSSLAAAKQPPQNHVSDEAAEKSANNTTPEAAGRWRQDVRVA